MQRYTRECKETVPWRRLAVSGPYASRTMNGCLVLLGVRSRVAVVVDAAAAVRLSAPPPRFIHGAAAGNRLAGRVRPGAARSVVGRGGGALDAVARVRRERVSSRFH